MCSNKEKYKEMSKYFITLVYEKLSQSEIIINLTSKEIPYKIIEKNNIFMILETEMETKFKEIGGIYKIGKIICEDDSIDKLDKKIYEKEILSNLQEKQKWNMSYYSKHTINPQSYEQIHNIINNQIKNNIKKSKIIKNNIQSNNFYELSVDKENQEYLKILLGYNGKKYYFSESTDSIKSSEFIERDLSRPYQDSKISLSPRTARILVNILGLKKGDTILDPFCGTGTFLMESLIKGYKVMGSDIRKECVLGTRNNLKWLIKKYKLKNKIKRINQDNAEKLFNVESNSVDGIITEPILLPNYKKYPTFDSAKEDLKKSKKIYEESLKSIRRVLKRNGKLAIVTPRIKTKNNEFVRFKFRDMIKKAGLIFNNKLDSQPFIMKSSDEQKIIREIWLLEKY